MNAEALAVAIAQVFAVGLYLYLGVRLAQRQVSPSSRLPARQFAVFWLGLALSASTSGAESFAAAFGSVPLGLEQGLLYANFVIVSVALWGLLTYLTYLYTGRGGLVPFTLLYGVEILLLFYYGMTRGIVGVSTANGAVNPIYGSASPGLLGLIALLLLVFPQFIAALLYFRLYFRTRDRTVRYRVTLVSWGLIAYFLLVFDFIPPIGPGLVGVVVQRVLLLLSIVVILFAYFPPGSLRAAFGIRGIEDSAMAGEA